MAVTPWVFDYNATLNLWPGQSIGSPPAGSPPVSCPCQILLPQRSFANTGIIGTAGAWMMRAVVDPLLLIARSPVPQNWLASALNSNATYADFNTELNPTVLPFVGWWTVVDYSPRFIPSVTQPPGYLQAIFLGLKAVQT